MMRREPRIPDADIERDVEEEIRFHIDSRVTELMAQGQPEETARRNAEAQFGDIAASRLELAAVDRLRRRRERVARWFEGPAQELRLAARSLRRSPPFAIAAVLTLAIGIGSSVAIFAVVDGVLLRPLPYGHPDRLVAAWHDLPGFGGMRVQQTLSTYFTYRQLSRSIEGIGLYREGEVNVSDPGKSGEPQRVSSASISATLLPVLQVRPILGRAFTEEDDRRGAPPVVLIGESMWRTRFADDPAILGRTLDVNGVGREIVGVLPAALRFPAAATQVWVPGQLDPLDPPGAGFEYGAVARVKPDFTVADAERDFAAVLPRAPELFPKFVPGISTRQIMDQVRPRPSLVPLREDMTGRIAATLWMVAAAAALLLLVACANVANLTLVRADAHQREMAVREALGAGRGRVMLYFFCESAVVAAVAAVAGIAGAGVAVRSLVAAGPPGIPRLAEVSVDGRAALFTLAIAALSAAACSVLPALRIGRGGLARREGDRSSTAGRGQRRARAGLVAAQIALALIVLAGSGLLMRTFRRLNAVRPGFDPENVSTFWISLPPPAYQTETAVGGFYSRLVERVAGLPGVQVVGVTSRLPLEPHGIEENPLYPEDDPTYATRLPPLQLETAINADYFRAMRIPILAGRTFDTIEAQREGDAVVSRATAEMFWKDPTGRAALGKRFRPVPGGRLYTVIGVAGDTRETSLAAPPTQVVYFPQTLEKGGGLLRMKRTMALVVRTSGGAAPIGPLVQEAVRELDATLPLFDVRPMTAVFRAATAQLSFIVLLLGSAAAVTLVLAAVGLYGVLAYVVTLRRRELGIRIALGATPRVVAAAMARYGIGLAGVGIALGLAMFAFVARFLRTALFGVAATDPVTLGGSAAILLAIALLASWVPARRAAAVDPADALRSD